MKLSITLLAAFLTLAPALRAQDGVDVGKEAIKNGNFLKAIDDLRDAAKKDKKNAQAFYWLGMAFFKAESLDQAGAALVQARDLDEKNALIYELMGDVYASQKLSAAAIQQFKRASELDSTNVPLLMKLGDASKKARMYTEAATAYTQIVKLDTVNEKALTELASLYTRGKQWANAARVLGMLAKMKPTDLTTQMSYFKALEEIKEYALIIEVGEHILTLNKDSQDVKEALAGAYKRRNEPGDLKKAADLFGTVNADSLDRDKLKAYAIALKSQDDYVKATDIMERAYRKDTSACDVPYDLGTFYMKLKKWREAIAMFEKKIACDTTTGFQFASHLNAGMSLMQIKEFKAALAHIQGAIDRRPDNIQAWLTLAQDYAQLSEDTKKVDAYQKVLDLIAADTANATTNVHDGHKAEAYRMIGVQYLLDKKYAKAVEVLKKALEFAPKDCQVLLWIAQSNQNSNNKEEAKKYYCKVLKTCPNTPQAKDAQKGLEVLGLKCED